MTKENYLTVSTISAWVGIILMWLSGENMISIAGVLFISFSAALFVAQSEENTPTTEEEE